MLFNSWSFILFFLPLTLTGYWLLRHHQRHSAAIVLLALASYAFYLAAEPMHPHLLLVSIAANFGFAHAMNGLPRRRARRRMLALAVASNLLMLAVFKYSNPLLAASAIGSGIAPNVIGLPAGISFFTFTQIAFLYDIYRGQCRDLNPARYALFVTFFPHLLAGPVVHHRELMPQFEKDRSNRLREHLWVGLALFVIGLAKKVLLADSLAPVASTAFDAAAAGAPLSAAQAWSGALAWTLQIYFDFSAYSDMALGVSRMFGIRLPINFNSPYQATSIIDFWRRWHITLSRFMRDHLYRLLRGPRRGLVRSALSLVATLLVVGLWHGLGWTFLIWGALHGLLLALNLAWLTLRRHFGLEPLPALAGWSMTFLAVVFCWVPFRAQDLSSTLLIWQAMLVPGMHNIMPSLEVSGAAAWPLIAIGLMLVWLAPNSQQILHAQQVGLDSPGYRALGEWRWPLGQGAGGPMQWRLQLAGALLMGVGCGLAMRWMPTYSEFIYLRF